MTSQVSDRIVGHGVLGFLPKRGRKTSTPRSDESGEDPRPGEVLHVHTCVSFDRSHSYQISGFWVGTRGLILGPLPLFECYARRVDPLRKKTSTGNR